MTNRISQLNALKLFDCENNNPMHYLRLAESSAKCGLVEDCNTYLLLAEVLNQTREYRQLDCFNSRRIVFYEIPPDEFYKKRSDIFCLLEKTLAN